MPPAPLIPPDVRTHTPNRDTDTTHASTHHPPTAKWGGAEVTKALLEAGAAVAQSTTLGVQPLHMAAQEGQVGVARLLLEHGAPAGATDRAGWSAFHYAANHRWATWRGDVSGQLEVLELLASHGANVDAGDGEGYTCAHSAAQSGKCEILRLLKRLGARPDAVTARGVMPVHVAAEGGRAEAVDELLRWDPGSLLAEDFRGHQPIHHAAYHGHADVVEVLLRHGAEVHPGKKRGAGKRGTDGDLIHHDGAQGAGSPLQGVVGSPNRGNREQHGTTPLHLAVRSGSVGVVAALLAGGADPRRRDSHGWTPRGLLQECANRKSTGAPATPVNQMSDADRAAEYAAMDSVLRRAEMGVPLVWSRAAHRLYPREFKRHARDVVLAACVPMTRHDVRGLAADKIVDQCLAADANKVWPEMTERSLWPIVQRVRSVAESRWAESCLRGIVGPSRMSDEMNAGVCYDARWGIQTLGWFGSTGVSNDGNPPPNALGQYSPPGSHGLVSAGFGGAGGFGLAKAAAVTRIFGGHVVADENGESEVESAPPPHLVHLQQQYHQTAVSMAVYHHLQRASAAALAA